MTTAQTFEKFIANLEIEDRAQISYRYGQITSVLNEKFRDTDSETANSLQVGSYGRRTAIKDISDLDMIYIMPPSDWDRFKDGRQSALLQEVKSAIQDRYPLTEIRGDGQVVSVTFANQEIEVVPGFENEDGSFDHPDTHNGGSWKTTDPRSEITEIANFDQSKNGNLRCLCKMMRAWKNKHGVSMGGLLIDTLGYNFLQTTKYFDDKSFMYFDEFVRDFFEYMANLPEQEYFHAPGSNQRVYCETPFQTKAKRAYKLSLNAIEAEGQLNVSDKWKKIFGRPFPGQIVKMDKAMEAEGRVQNSWRNTEQFIEDKYPIDIRYNLKIDCEVKQNGFRQFNLLDMLARKIPLLASKKLHFEIASINVPKPYRVEWKVLNRGEVAQRKDCLRGQIVNDEGSNQKTESTDFRGPHIVECYAIKNNVVVAKDRIDVPIESGE